MILEDAITMKKNKNKITKAFLLVFVLACLAFTQQALSQPGKTATIAYFEKYIKYNEDRSSVLKHIHNLRLKLSDTLVIEQNIHDTTWLKKHRDATYVNFLCFLYESKLVGGNSCRLQLGIKNYAMFYRYRELSQFPQPSQYESEYEEAINLQKSICINVYIKNATNAEFIPDSACGCSDVITKLKKEQDEMLLAAEKAETNRIQAEIKQRQMQTKDSLTRLNEKILQEPIYLTNGVLRADSTYKINSKNVGSLNTLMVLEMLRASNNVFSFAATTCSSDNVEIMLDALAVQKRSQFRWLIKLKKINGELTLIDDLSLHDIENRVLFKLIAALYLAEINSFIEENEVLVLPFNIYINNTYTDNKTVEYKIENGFVHVILPVILLNPHELVPSMTPEEYENSEFERKRTRE